MFSQQRSVPLYDAQNIEFDDTNTLRLNTKWQFHFGNFLSAMELDTAETILLKVPKPWKKVKWKNQQLPGQGIATYRITVLLNHEYSELAIKVPDQSSCYELYIDDELIGSAGKIGLNKASTIPETKPQILSFHPKNKQFDIIFHVANFHHKKGGLWESITLGKKSALLIEQSKYIYYDIFLFGSLLIIALYHFGLFLLRKTNRSALLFSILACCAIIRVMSTGQKLITELLPFLSWDWRVSLEHIPFYLIMGLGVMYSDSLFPKESRRSIVIPIFLFSCSLALTVALSPAIFFSHLIVPFEIVTIFIILYLFSVMIAAIKHKRKGAIAYTLGFLCIACTGINDILLANHLVTSVFLFPYGIFTFFISQTFVLSSKSADTFKQVEQLSIKLKEINLDLEAKVANRTKEIASQNKVLEQTAKQLMASNTDLEHTKSNLEDTLQKEHNFRMELETTIKQLKAAQAQLIQSEKMVSLGRLTAGIAHEINNPMNFISAGVEVLSELIKYNQEMMQKYHELEQADEANFQRIILEVKELKHQLEFEETQKELTQVVADIMKGAERTIEIIQGLRNFSRTDELEKTPTNLHDCIDSTLIILKNNYKNTIEIVLNYDPQLPYISCNPGQINQVLMNLLTNAIQAIKGKGKIEISTTFSKENSSVQLSIKDTGKGIPKELIAKVFDPFFTTKPVGEGTGLGLSISHGIIEKHKGHMQVHSEEGVGTEFLIELPYSPH